MNKKLLITSIIAFAAIIALTATALVLTNQTPDNYSPAPGNNTPVNLSVNGPDSTVDYGVAEDVSYELLAPGVSLTDIAGKVAVTDSDGNAVGVSFTEVSDGVFAVNAPEGGYIPGGVYTIALAKGVSFSADAKAGCTEWDFIIAKAPVQDVQFQDNVISLSTGTFNIASDTELVSIADFAVGTVLIVPVGVGYEAYKVVSSAPNAGGGYVLTVSEPEEDEVYKSIDLSGTYALKDGILSFNSEVFLDQLYKSEIVLGLNLPTPSISFPKASIDAEEGLVYLDILITFSNFIPDVESSFSILLSNVISIDPFINYSTAPLNFNIGADMAINTTTTFSFTVGANYDGQYNAEELIAQLAEMTKQTVSENFLRVFSWTLPLGNTGLMLSYDLDLVLRVDFAGTLTATTESYSAYRLGVYYVNGDLKSMCDKKSSSFSLESVELFGNLETKAGVLNTLSLSFLQIAKVAIKLEAGLYADLYGAVVINLDEVMDTQGGYYLDTGLYYDLSISAGIEILGFGTSKDIPLVGDKYSLYESGSRTMVVDYALEAENGAVDSIVVTSKDTLLPALTVKQYDLVSHQYSYVKVGPEKSDFVLDGSENFTVSGGVLTLKAGAEDTFANTLTVQYKTRPNVEHIITISKDREMPYVTSDAIQTFDKSAPADLTFDIDLLGKTFDSLVATDLTEEDYDYTDGTLTLDWNYLIRRANGVLELTFTTSANTVTLWASVENAVSLFTVGAGTVADPYMIYTVDQLTELSALAAAGNLNSGVYFALADDVDMRGESFTPIADFAGVFDGCGYTISNFVIDKQGADNAAGLFVKNSGTIKNLTVNGSVVFNGQRYVTTGAIAGLNYGTIDNCVALGTVDVACSTNDLNRTFFNIGGVVGKNYGTISNTSASNQITVSSSSYNLLTKVYMGGIAGFNDGTISNCSGSASNINDESVWYNTRYKADIAND